MNTDMAPMEHLQEARMVEMRRRRRQDDTENRRRDGSDGGKRDDSNGGGGDGNGGGDGGGGGGDKNPDNNGNGNDKNKNNNNQPPPSPPPAATSTVVIISATTVVAAPSITSTSSKSSSTAFSSQSSFSSITPTLAASVSTSVILVPTTVSNPAVPLFTNPPSSSQEGRKGVDTADNVPTSSPTKQQKTKTPKTTTVIAATALGSTATESALPDLGAITRGPGGGLSPTAEHLLIAAGAIGALIMLVTGIYFLLRMKNTKMFAIIQGRKFGKGGKRGWYGWRKTEMDLPPMYSSKGYPSDDASYYPSDEKYNTQDIKGAMPSSTAPPLSAAQQLLIRQAAMAVETGSPRQTMVPITQRGYTPKPGHSSKPSIANTTERDSGYNDPTAVNTLMQSYNNTYNSNATYNTNNTSNLYDPDQRELNHLSVLSSLSSGFGDQIIIPEADDPSPNLAPRQSARQSRKFSWFSTAPGMKKYGDRDTMMTTGSVDEAPRFRTVKSWVAQQTGRVEKQTADTEIPKMPDVPTPAQLAMGSNHQRNLSEDPKFKQHPGNEIEFATGQRIPSAILDSKTGIN